MPADIRFGVYELDLAAMELRKHGVVIRVQEQPFRVLAALLEKPGEVVTREELKQHVWADGTFVDFDQSLNKAVNRLRELLHDDSSQPRYIETVPRRGYRFVAPVIDLTVPIQAERPESVSGNIRRKHVRIPPWIVSLVALMILCITVIAVYMNSRRLGGASSRRVLIEDAFSPAVSRDGKLLAYVSVVGGGVPHIWARQVEGARSIQVTSGSSRDFGPVFSPDGTQILYFSDRDGGGIYVAPTFSGEAKLLLAGGYEPVFSPDGKAILCLKDDGRLVVLPADGGAPSPIPEVTSKYQVVAPPLWSPSGNRIMFFGRQNGQPASANRWRITSASGGSSSPVAGTLLETVNGVRPRLYQWMARGGKFWITYSRQKEDTWTLFRVRISRDAEPVGRPEELDSGAGELEQVAPDSDGHQLIYAVTEVSGEIFQIPLDHEGQKYEQVAELPLTEGPRYYSPSVSHDGRLMAYVKVAGRKGSVLIRDFATGIDSILDAGLQPIGDPVASISPDGAYVVFNRRCWCEIDIQDCPSFLIAVKGGNAEQICTNCTPRGFSSYGSFILTQKYEPIHRNDTIIAMDLHTKQERDFLSDSGYALYHAYLSWDDRWVVFKRLLGASRAQILIAPVRAGHAASKAEWIPITDGRFSDDKPQISPDGNTVYFTSDRDGYLCIWAQRLNSITKHPKGAAVPVQHFHNSLGRNAASDARALRLSDLTVGSDKIFINLPLVDKKIWITRNN